MRRVAFSNGEYYHIFNRGVDKRITFLDTRDYERFLYLVFACNDVQPLLNSQFYYRGLTSIETYPRKREPIVDIISFCVMPNHFHFLLHERTENGISRFMQKLGTGYTMYFNTRYKRSGALFQGTFKSRHIDPEAYLLHIATYIHLNPVGISPESFRVQNGKDTYEHVQRYPWSSYTAFIGESPFDVLLNKKLITELYPEPKEYKRWIKEWVMRGPPDTDWNIEKYILE